MMRILGNRWQAPLLGVVAVGENRISMVEWLAAYPPGPRREAILLHEQAHSRREGVLWFVRYALSRDFRWSEEAIGWGLEIEPLIRAGVGVDVDHVADALSGGIYESWDGIPMVDREVAKRWVLEIIKEAGTTWDPRNRAALEGLRMNGK